MVTRFQDTNLVVECEANRSYLNTGTCYICIFTVTYMSPTKMVTVKKTHSMVLHAKRDMKHMKLNSPLNKSEAILYNKLNYSDRFGRHYGKLKKITSF